MKQNASKPYAATRSVATLTVLSVLGPMSGLVMEMVLAWSYGASGTVDAFRIASLVLVLGNQVFFGNLLPHVIVPMFLEFRAKGFECDGWRLAFSMSLILSLTSLILISWVWLDPSELARLLGPGLQTSGRGDFEVLIRYFSLALLLMVWSGVIIGILAIYRVFWLSAIAQLLPNIFVIIAVFLIGKEWGVGAIAIGNLLGYAALLGLSCYTLIQIIKDSHISLVACLRLGPRDGLVNALYLSVPLTVTIFIGQCGSIIINRELSGMPPGSLAEFGFAWKLLALVNLLPTGLATVIFPAFADAHANNNPTEFSRLVTRAFRLTLLLTLPLAAALFVERITIVSMMFGSGGMGMREVDNTTELFGILLIGAPPAALSAALCKVAFSMQDTKSPTIVALMSALAIAGLVPYAAINGGANNVAWSLTTITWISALIMLGYQIYKYRIMPAWEAIRSFSLMMVLCLGMVIPVIAIRRIFELNTQISVVSNLIEMQMAGILFLVIGYALSRLLGIHEISEIGCYIRWQAKNITYIKKLTRDYE